MQSSPRLPNASIRHDAGRPFLTVQAQEEYERRLRDEIDAKLAKEQEIERLVGQGGGGQGGGGKGAEGMGRGRQDMGPHGEGQQAGRAWGQRAMAERDNRKGRAER